MFITLEGPDASGKTTIINGIIAKLLELKPNLDYVLTREPGGKDIMEAEKIRSLILDPKSNISDVSEALLYSASRRIHLERVIWPALKAKKLVMCDRYVDSFYAYQGFARGLGLDYVKKITNLVIDKTMPDITIFLDITPQESEKRKLQTRLIQDRLDSENMEFHKKVYSGYQSLIKMDPERFILVNAAKGVSTVLKEAIKKLLNHPRFVTWFKEL